MWALVERTLLVRRFRCSACGTWLETPVYWKTEVEWRKRAKPGPLPDQLTIYDLEGLDVVETTEHDPDRLVPLSDGAAVAALTHAFEHVGARFL